MEDVREFGGIPAKRIFIGGIPIKMDESKLLADSRNPQRVLFAVWQGQLLQTREK